MKKLLLLLLIINPFIISYSQSSHYDRYRNKENNQTKGFDINKLTLGGNFGLQFGDYTTINIAPQVGYSFNKYVNAGAGLSYTYYRYKYDFNSADLINTRSYLGFNLYARFYPIDYLVLMIQPEANRMWSSFKEDRTSSKYSESKFVPVVLVGGGLRFGPVSAMIQYDIVQDKNSPYGDKLFYTLGYTWNF